MGHNMRLATFVDQSGILEKTEIEKVELLAFYFFKVENLGEFSVRNINFWFSELGLPKVNTTRLSQRITQSSSFMTVKRGIFKLHAKRVKGLEAEYPELNEESEEIICLDTILPKAVYEGTGRPVIDSLALQINAAYEYHIFDGCAVLMRRLLEILLILSYRHLGIENEIKDGDSHFRLESIIGNAKSNSVLLLSKSTKDNLQIFRTLGNFSAHGLYHTAKQSEIRNNIVEYVAIIEELLFKSGLKT